MTIRRTCHKFHSKNRERILWRMNIFFICLVGSVNSVFKFLEQPGETRFHPGEAEISSGVPMAFNSRLTEPEANKDYFSKNRTKSFLESQRVSNPSTENQWISTPAHSNGYEWEMHVSSELMVQIKQKGVYGSENPLPRSCWVGRRWISNEECSCLRGTQY